MIVRGEFKLNSFANELNVLNEIRGLDMPKVGKRHYPYTAKGRAAAKKAATKARKKRKPVKGKDY